MKFPTSTIFGSRVSLILLLLFVFFSSFSLVLAQEQKEQEKCPEGAYCLSVPLPGERGGFTTQVQLEEFEDLGQYISTLYKFALGIVGLLALGMIVYGAIQYTASAGSIARQQDARDRITQAIIGLALLLGAFLILYTINPNMTELGKPLVPPASDKKVVSDEKLEQGFRDAKGQELYKAALKVWRDSHGDTIKNIDYNELAGWLRNVHEETGKKYAAYAEVLEAIDEIPAKTFKMWLNDVNVRKIDLEALQTILREEVAKRDKFSFSKMSIENLRLARKNRSDIQGALAEERKTLDSDDRVENRRIEAIKFEIMDIIDAMNQIDQELQQRGVLQ